MTFADTEPVLTVMRSHNNPYGSLSFFLMASICPWAALREFSSGKQMVNSRFS
jgi:hypothetical protein